MRDRYREQYEKYKKMRVHEFMDGFQQISGAVKEIYQMITLQGDAALELVDSLDPFSEGISFRFQTFLYLVFLIILGIKYSSTQKILEANWKSFRGRKNTCFSFLGVWPSYLST
jgi:hypothetical protein